MTFGGWSIDVDLFNWLKVNLPKGKTILELGSGLSTSELVKLWNVYSVEENQQWVNAFHQQYIHAPIVDDWYDRKALQAIPSSYDLLLVDGPAYGTRNEMNRYLEDLKFYTSDCKIVVFDDVNRSPDLTCYNNFMKEISSSKTYETNILRTSGGKAFSYIKFRT
jgi:hypothetical protein